MHPAITKVALVCLQQNASDSISGRVAFTPLLPLLFIARTPTTHRLPNRPLLAWHLTNRSLSHCCSSHLKILFNLFQLFCLLLKQVIIDAHGQVIPGGLPTILLCHVNQGSHAPATVLTEGTPPSQTFTFPILGRLLRPVIPLLKHGLIQRMKRLPHHDPDIVIISCFWRHRPHCFPRQLHVPL